MNKSYSYSKQRTKKGQSLLEFAVVFPIFIAVVLFLIDILRFYFLQQTLSFQVREGLRAGVVYDPSNPPTVTSGDPPVSTVVTRRQVIINAVNASNLYGFTISYTGGPTAANPNVVVTLTPSDGGAKDEVVTLKMDYQNFTFLTPFLGVLFETQPTGSIPLSVSQSFQNESQD